MSTEALYNGICVGGPLHGQSLSHYKPRKEIVIKIFNAEDFKMDHRNGVYVLEDIEWKWKSEA